MECESCRDTRAASELVEVVLDPEMGSIRCCEICADVLQKDYQQFVAEWRAGDITPLTTGPRAFRRSTRLGRTGLRITGSPDPRRQLKRSRVDHREERLPRPEEHCASAFERQFYLLYLVLSGLLPEPQRFSPETASGDALILHLWWGLGTEGDEERIGAAERFLNRIGSPVHSKRLRGIEKALAEEAWGAGNDKRTELTRRALHGMFSERVTEALDETLASHTVPEVNAGAAVQAIRAALDEEIPRDLDPTLSWMRKPELEARSEVEIREWYPDSRAELSRLKARLTWQSILPKAGLTDAEQQVFEMRSGGFTHREIASELDLLEATSCSYYHQAKKKLQAVVQTTR